MLWWMMGLPAVYFGIGGIIATIINKYAVTLLWPDWLYVACCWPYLFFHDVDIPRQ